MPEVQNRLIVVSNRLPITITQNRDGKYEFKLSSGGLVSALSGLKKLRKFIWIGWPGNFCHSSPITVGLEVPEIDKHYISETLEKEHNCIPIFLDRDTADKYYRGFSNSTIWPLFHYLPGDFVFDNEFWDGYQLVNNIFAVKISEIVKNNDIIWIHDYHLMLLPMCLRQKVPIDINIKIGFFLHTPFPSSEIYR